MVTKTDKKNAIRQGIIDAAIVYSQNLGGKTFLYVYGDEYFEVSFPIDHFLHLTGVETRLSAKDFFKNAKKSILTNNQFYFDARHVYANAFCAFWRSQMRFRTAALRIKSIVVLHLHFVVNGKG